MLLHPSSLRVSRPFLIRGVSLMRDLLTTIFELLGCALVVAGVALVSVPLSLIVAGGLMIGVSFLVADR